jgi:secreted trypsin-like serine protease
MYQHLGSKVMVTAAIVGTVLIQPGSARQETSKGNWMAEYVELRRSARTLRGMADAARSGAVQVSLIQPRIVGGTPATASDNAFQVGLLRKVEKDNFKAQFCGGTLIGPNVVVTAAHCSDFVTREEVQVLTAARKLDGTGTRHDVTSIAIHQSWNPDTFDNDVAVWKLASPAKVATFATLATAEAAAGVQLLATGWGQLTQGGSRPVDLMKVQVPVVELSNCNDANSYNGAITGQMFCAGLDAGGKDTCQGDSGGPLTGGTGNAVLNGITSWGRGCAQANFFGVYTRVANPSIREFIEKNAK